MCVTPFSHPEAAYSLSSAVGCNPNQSKALSPLLRFPLFSNGQSKLSRFSNPPTSSSFFICNFTFSFLSCQSVHFQSYLKTVPPPPLKPVYIKLICLWQRDASMLLGEVLWKCVERIKVRPQARTNPFYLYIQLLSFKTGARTTVSSFSVLNLAKLSDSCCKTFCTAAHFLLRHWEVECMPCLFTVVVVTSAWNLPQNKIMAVSRITTIFLTILIL